MQIDGNNLLKSWADAKARGLKQSEHAIELGLKYTTYASRMTKALAGSGAAATMPESRYPVYNQAFEITGDALVMGDLHAPLQDSKFVNQCVGLAIVWGINTCILGGDTVDAGAFSHWAKPTEGNAKKSISFEAERELLDTIAKLPADQAEIVRATVLGMTREPRDMGDELKETRSILRSLINGFDNIYAIQGNHENRVVRLIERTMPIDNLSELFWGQNAKVRFSEYYHCNLTSGGVKYHITHPKPAGKGASKRLASKFLCNVIMFHNHHLFMASDPSGNFLALEPGGCADFGRVDYLQLVDSATDTPMNGAVIIRNGKPWALNKWSDFDALKRMA